MRTALICTGSELLKGTTINTNMAFIGSRLTELGIPPEQSMVISDSPDMLHASLVKLAPEADIIITTGGLGPTCDDLTRQAVCSYFDLKLEENPEVRTFLEERWARRRCGSSAPHEYYSQALAPEGATILKNRVGTAPGLFFEGVRNGHRNYIVMLPGPPSELNPMVDEELVPLLRELTGKYFHTEGFMLAGGAELYIQKQIEPLLENCDITLALCASVQGVKVFLSGKQPELVAGKTAELKAFFGDQVMHDGCFSLAEDVSALLREQKLSLSTAESCTGGMIAAAITDLAGSSQIFTGSIVAYHNEVKNRELGVPGDILETRGAVSSECVAAMVDGVCAKFNTPAGIAVSGIAGPGGATPEKPLGLVYIGVKLHDKREVREFHFHGDRNAVRQRAMSQALLLLRELLISEKS